MSADIAFLVMDLERLGAREAADALLDGYRGAGGDPGSDALIAFHAVQRAWVRAKVALVRAAEGDREADAAAFAALARRFVWRARMPLALVVCGPAASGKSTLAERLAAASGWDVHSSDSVRKRLVGIEPEQRGSADLYTAGSDRATYQELGRRAAAGGSIVDATCRRADERAALLAELRAPAVFVECKAPAAVIAARADARELEPRRVSDATAAVALRQQRDFEPFDELAPQAHLAVRSDRPPDEITREVEALLDARL